MEAVVDTARRTAFRPLTGLSRLARRAVLPSFEALSRGGLSLEDADGVRSFGAAAPGAPRPRLRIFDPAVYGRVLLGGTIAAGEAYADGQWDAGTDRPEDLTALCRHFVANRGAMNAMDAGAAGFLRRAAERLAHRLRPNDDAGARRNIRAHYDLGNDFFKLFLDETWMYSSAVFEHPDASAAEAQTAKIDRLCRKLRLTPQDRVLEIGTGWGGFAIHAAREYGCRVTTTTISPAQHALARERIEEAGLSGRITLLLEDYRTLAGTYDKLVSVEMVEAVGLENLGVYFRTLSRLLAPDGAAAVQAILIRDQYYEQARRSVDFIQKHIFPGAGIPSVGALLGAMTDASDLRLVHMEDFASHYARTLRGWHDHFWKNRDRLLAAGYPERLLGLWRFYFSYCEAGFIERQVGVAQLVFAKPDNRMEPILGAL